jgi:hypothetical protein
MAEAGIGEPGPRDIALLEIAIAQVRVAQFGVGQAGLATRERSAPSIGLFFLTSSRNCQAPSSRARSEIVVEPVERLHHRRVVLLLLRILICNEAARISY